MLSTDDTIVAIATAPGGSARGIVRLSGPQSIACVAASFQPHDPSCSLQDISFARAIPGVFHLLGEADLRPLDVPVDLFMWPDERSYTRQPAAELHAPGAPPLLAAMAEQLLRHGARAAAPGEFTLRAFLAGRIDLTQAEAVLGVVDAQSQRDLDAALTQLAGGLTRPLHQLRYDLLALLAELEAGLDFVDEDIEFVSRDALAAQLVAASAALAAARRQLAVERQRPSLPRVALAGLPNAGKSRLFNALVAEFSGPGPVPNALVADVPGTTRDYVTARLHFGDVEWELVDTAGASAAVDLLRDAPGGFEAGATPVDTPHSDASPGAEDLAEAVFARGVDEASQRMTRQGIEQADLRLLCLDVSAGLDLSIAALPRDTLLVWTKVDLIDKEEWHAATLKAGWPPNDLSNMAVSSVTLAGIADLGRRIAQALAEKPSETMSAAAVRSTTQRCATSLQRAADAVLATQELLADRGGDELLAAELRAALDALGDVAGAVCADDVLDRVFSQFCIGK